MAEPISFLSMITVRVVYTSMAKNPERTRYHEAGHSVIGVREGWHCAAIVVEGLRRGYSGGSSFGTIRLPPAVSAPATGALAERIRSRIRLKVAGEMAAVKLTGERWDIGCADDYDGSPHDHGARELASLLIATTDPTARDDLVAEVEAEVTDTLADPAVWGIVEALADQLETSPRMLGAEVAQFFAEHGIAMPPLKILD